MITIGRLVEISTRSLFRDSLQHFKSEVLERSQDYLHQILVFYDCPFFRYGCSQFLLRKGFGLANVACVANQNKVKKTVHFRNSQ